MGFQASDVNTIDKNVTDMVLGEVKRTFNPEFINRIDEIIVFEALADDDLRRIMALLVTQLNENLVDRKLYITLTPEVVDWIIEITCKDRSYGARPLRRAIQRYVEDPLSEELIRGHLRGSTMVLADGRPVEGAIEIYMDAGQIAYRPAGGLEAGRKLA
jgi:ATP-dependent Clp protease ATP-binding subunit ClpC